MGIRDILDETIDLYKSHLGVFLAIAAIYIPYEILQGLWLGAEASLSASPPEGWSLREGLIAVPENLLHYLVTGVVTVAAYEHLRGQKTTALDAYRAFLRRFRSFLPALLLLLPLGIVAEELSESPSWLVLPGLLISFSLMFAVPLFVVESQTGFKAVWGSIRIFFAHPFKNGACMLSLLAIVFILMGILYIPMESVFGGEADSWLQRIVAGSVDGVMGMVLTPLFSIVSLLLYLDHRIRREGFDLELLSEDLQRAASDRNPGADARPTRESDGSPGLSEKI